MMKYLILLACVIIGIVTAAPTDLLPTQYEIIPILSSELNKHEDGSYNLHYAGGDGTSRQEEANVVDEGTDDQTLEIKGSYKYINSEGEEVEVSYTAGKNGFVPYGSIINPEISAAAEAAKDLPKSELEEPNNKSESF
ncbi:endocuticle structural protein SgAbd-6-like isoform X2 [Eurosta solidaginis]|uniref:endocuticle structural protein SgAbd-6-like isoform X2 n=1 Tax=Eurosta solidaginis TaxID=178769 RepID=UPI0035312861